MRSTAAVPPRCLERLPQDNERMQTSTLSLATSIPATTRSSCAIIQLPSLLGPGSKPMQLFGLRKTPDLSHAPRQALGPSSTNGLRSSDGRLVENRPFAHSADFADTRARRKPLKPLRAGMPGDPGVTVVTNARVYYTPRAAAGATGTRHSPRPHFWGGISWHTSDVSRRERAKACPKPHSTSSSLRTQGPITTGFRVVRRSSNGILQR